MSSREPKPLPTLFLRGIGKALDTLSGANRDQDQYDRQWPGFDVSCHECGSRRVVLGNAEGEALKPGQIVSFRCTVCNPED